MLERREDGYMLARQHRIPRALAREPEQVALAGQIRDQQLKALSRFGREVGQCGDMEHTEGRVRRRLSDGLGEDGKCIPS